MSEPQVWGFGCLSAVPKVGAHGAVALEQTAILGSMLEREADKAKFLNVVGWLKQDEDAIALAGACHELAYAVKEGDYVIALGDQVYVGVLGPYRYLGARPEIHMRDVVWKSVRPPTSFSTDLISRLFQVKLLQVLPQDVAEVVSAIG